MSDIEAARAEAAERARREAEEAERRRQARIRELRNQLSGVESRITHFENVLRRLTDARTSMNSLKNRLNTEVDTPVITYNLHGASKWEGTNALNGVVALANIKNSKSAYDSDVEKLISDIGRGVDRANSILQDLYRQRNNILSELRSLGA
ncbi:YwqH-like family protein [Pseudobutyrivibrio xylanivorans]|uniref:DUF5082 domain-containing protein n=1 Tax=Pseudobutyrivibrio xylanivorans TaxID=185007 RepID=A0A1G5S330_PSEXY|nr:hypothetical protein [Pseudobutyrivibrio xylanivorans]SCZ80723.1 hypothetical protein SAMN02910350_02443 [Pseudobutyrivibrio xylanivorans]